MSDEDLTILADLKKEAGIDSNIDDAGVVGSKKGKARRLSVKDIANYYVPQFQTLDDTQQKPYARHLIKNERVIYDGVVLKRSGWSFKNRYLILTDKPRIFYTTLQGHFKGLIPWSMTEPIQITQTDTHHFHITIHTSSRVYHFNDQIQGASKWVEIITELCACWKTYLETVLSSMTSFDPNSCYRDLSVKDHSSS